LTPPVSSNALLAWAHSANAVIVRPAPRSTNGNASHLAGLVTDVLTTAVAEAVVVRSAPALEPAARARRTCAASQGAMCGALVVVFGNVVLLAAIVPDVNRIPPLAPT